MTINLIIKNVQVSSNLAYVLPLHLTSCLLSVYGFLRKRFVVVFFLDKCKNDIQCSKKEACVTGKCVDPCEGHCHKDNTACYVSNHKPQCVCLHNYVGDPHQGCRPGNLNNMSHIFLLFHTVRSL